LARMDIRDAVLVQPVLSGPQRGHADHVWRAVLKSPGILVEMERMDRPNAGAAAAHLFDAYVLANTKAPETIRESLCQLHLARMDIRDAVLVQPVLSGPQRGHADHVWRAVLKSPGILVEMERMD